MLIFINFLLIKKNVFQFNNYFYTNHLELNFHYFIQNIHNTSIKLIYNNILII
jgi:hypothetical protein